MLGCSHEFHTDTPRTRTRTRTRTLTRTRTHTPTHTHTGVTGCPVQLLYSTTASSPPSSSPSSSLLVVLSNNYELETLLEEKYVLPEKKFFTIQTSDGTGNVPNNECASSALKSLTRYNV